MAANDGSSHGGQQARVGPAPDYFERYERSSKARELDDSNDGEYWLSEEEDETRQFQQQKRKSRRKRSSPEQSQAKGPSLRPAQDIFKRLQWDPEFEVSDYVVGYLERFDGVKEMPAASWLRDVTEEDFIPLHRIKYFRRVQDGEVIWDRDSRIDKFFRSGVTGIVVDGEEKKTRSSSDQEGCSTVEEIP